MTVGERPTSARAFTRDVRQMPGDSLLAPITVLVTADLRHSAFNEAYVAWLGEPASALSRMRFDEALGPARWSRLEPFVAEALATGRPVEFDLVPGAPADRALRCRVLPMLGPGGEQAGFQVFLVDVSHERETDERLRRSEARYRSLAESTEAVIWTAQADGSIAGDVPGWEQLTGQGEAACRGLGWLDAIDTGDRARVEEAWMTAAAAGAPVRVVCRVKTPAGGSRRMRLRAAPVLERDGRITEYVGAWRDVEARESERETAAETRTRIVAALRAARMVTWTWDPQADEVTLSANALEMLGVESAGAEEILAHIHADDRGVHAERIAVALKARTEYIARVRWLRPPNGEVLWLEMRARAGRLSTGQYGLSGVARDVTEVVHAEEAAARSSEELEHALAAGRMVAWSWDGASDWMTVSQNVAELFGVADGGPVPLQDVLSHVHADDRAAHLALVRRALATEGEYTSRFRYLWPADGHLAWLEDHARASRSPAGGVQISGIVRDVTDEVRAQERLALAQRSARMGTWDWTAETGEFRWSQELEAVYGLAPGGFGHTAADYLSHVHPEDRELVRQEGRRFLEGRGQPFEHRILLPDGSVRWLLMAGTTTYDVQGGTTGATGVGIDITERVLAEEARLESEQRYRTLVDATASIVWTAAASGRFAGVQHSWEAYTGQPWEAHRELGWVWAIHPEDRERFARIWSEARSEGRLFDVQARLWHATTSGHRHVQFRAVPLRARDGTIQEWIGTATDIHDQVTAEEAEREVQARFSALIAALPANVVVTDGEGLFAWGNAAFMDYFRPDRPVFSPRDYVHPDHQEFTGARFQEARRTGEGFQLEYRLRRYDGEYRWHRLSMRPVVGREGRVGGWMGVSLDIEETRRMVEELKSANQAKDEFLGFVSHEMKTPLTTVVGLAEVLSRRLLDLDPMDVREAIETLHRDALRLQGIIENMLTLAKMDNADIHEPVLVQRVIPRIVERFRRLYPDRTLLSQLDEGLPSVSAPISWIEQLVENLVSNAEKYSPAGTPIEITAGFDDQRRVEVAVADRGPGVSPEIAQRLFEPFYRGAANNLSVPGLGLGLTVCKRMVERLDGDIAIRQREGGGSVASFRLPGLEADW